MVPQVVTITVAIASARGGDHGLTLGTLPADLPFESLIVRAFATTPARP